MKRNIILVIAIFCSFTVFSQGIEFSEGSWESILKRAKEENKLVFVDGTTEWCKPCKWMEKNVFTKPVVGEFYNNHFINVKMDMEKGEGMNVKKKYNIYAYPTLLFVDSTGATVHRNSGAKDVEAFIKVGATAIDPSKNLMGMNKKYDAGERSQAFIQTYIPLLGHAYYKEKQKEIFDWYYYYTPKDSLINAADFQVIMSVADMDSKAFKWVLKNHEAFKKVIPEDEYDFRLYAKMIVPFSRLVYNDEMEMMQQEATGLRPLYPQAVQKAEDMAIIRYYRKMELTEKLYKACIAYVEKYALNKADVIIYCMKMIVEGEAIDNQPIYKKAMRLMQKVYQQESDNYRVGDIYAALLFKSGQQMSALAEAKRVVENTPHEQQNDLWSKEFLESHSGITN